MEFVIGLAVVAVICVILGVGADVMITGALGILALIVLATSLFFIAFLVILVTSRKTEAVFKEIAKKENGKFKTAIYIIDDMEYPCFFPAEPEFVYKKKKTCRVMLNRRLGRVFDSFSVVTCIVGSVFSIAALIGAIWIAVYIVQNI